MWSRAHQEIVAWNIGAPADWTTVPLTVPGAPETEAAIVASAEDVTSSPEAAEALATLIRTAQPGVIADSPILVALWVPDPSVGYPMAYLKAQLWSDAGRKDFVKAMRDAPPAQGAALAAELHEIQLAAGPALLVDRQDELEDGVIEQTLIFGLFPEGTRDAISLTFSTTALHLIEDFALTARDIAETVEVQLGAERVG